MNDRKRKAIAFYLMISPFLVVYLLMSLFPLLYGFYLSMTNYYGFNMDNLSFMGWYQYKLVFTDTDAMSALLRTLIFALINVPVSAAVAFLLALMLSGNIRGGGIFRTIFYLPSIVPVISTIFMWKMIFSGNGGMLNTILGWFGLPETNWLGYDHAFTSLIVMMSWGAGSGIIIYLAGLKGIPREMYEAASIDGAGAWGRFLRITIPLMTPVTFFNIIMMMISTLQVYLQPILLNGNELLARPLKPTYLYAVHAFQQIFAYQRFAYGMALLWVLFVVIMLLTVVVFKTSKYWVYYENEQGR